MNTIEKTVIRRIEWFNQESEMILSCENTNGSLCYSTKLTLPSTSLNRLLMDLQKQNPDIDVNECLKIEQWSEEDMYFIYDFSELLNIEYCYIQNPLELNLRQIRA